MGFELPGSTQAAFEGTATLYRGDRLYAIIPGISNPTTAAVHGILPHATATFVGFAATPPWSVVSTAAAVRIILLPPRPYPPASSPPAVPPRVSLAGVVVPLEASAVIPGRRCALCSSWGVPFCTWQALLSVRSPLSEDVYVEAMSIDQTKRVCVNLARVNLHVYWYEGYIHI